MSNEKPLLHSIPRRPSTLPRKHSRIHSSNSTSQYSSSPSVTASFPLHASTTTPQISLHHRPPDRMLSVPSATSDGTSSSSRQVSTKTPSRIFTTMRRLGQPSKRREHDLDIHRTGMYSTPEERSTPPHFRFHGSSAPPTIEQIAMGLHISRTPHLRPTHRSRHSAPPSPPAGPIPARLLHDASISHKKPTTTSPPSPPVRSPLKKSSSSTSAVPQFPSSSTVPETPGLSSASLTTVTSNTPSTPSTPSTRSVASLKTRMMAKLLRGRDRSNLPPPSGEKERRDSTDSTGGPRKAVRFTDEAERSHANDDDSPSTYG